MIKEIAIEPDLVIEWSNKRYRREFKPIDIRREYGLGSPKRMSRYPQKWRKIIGNKLSDLDSLQVKRVEELAKAILENSIRRRGYIWDGEASWYDNALYENDRIAFEAILCRANFKGHDRAIALVDFQNEEEEKLDLLKLPHGATPKRNKEDLINLLKPWLIHSNKVLIIDPYFDPNRKGYYEPLKELINKVLTDCEPKGYPFFEIVRKHDENAPTLEHLKTGFKDRICKYLPDEFEIYFSVLEEKQTGEKLHQRYILTEYGGVRIDPGFDVQDDPTADETYDINLLDEDQYLKRWEQYYLSDNTFDLKYHQLVITGDGISKNI